MSDFGIIVDGKLPDGFAYSWRFAQENMARETAANITAQFHVMVYVVQMLGKYESKVDWTDFRQQDIEELTA